MEATELESLFTRLGIDYSYPEFYNQPAFLEAEKNNSHILWDYEEYVLKRAYSPEYEAKAKTSVPRIIQYLFDELVKDGRLGACADASLVASKILEQYGFWNAIQTGSFTAVVPDAPSRKIRYWPEFMPRDNPAKIGHAWLAVPPFKLVDLTVTRQIQNEDLRPLLPPFVAATEVGPVDGVRFEDMVDVDLKKQWLRQTGNLPDIGRIMKDNPPVAEHMTRFRPFSVQVGTSTLKYFPIRPTLAEEKFEDHVTQCFSGRTTPQLLKEMSAEIGSPEELGYVPNIRT